MIMRISRKARRSSVRSHYKQKKRLCVVIGAALSCVSGFVILGAAQANEETKQFTPRVYIGGGVGASQLEPRTPNQSITVSEQNDTGFHVTLGYDFTTRLSAEVYFADLGAAGISFLGSEVGDIDYQVAGLSAIVYVLNSRSGFNGSRSNNGIARREGLSLYGRVGVGGVSANSELDHTVNNEVHLALGAGLEYGFGNGFALRGEFLALDTDQQYASIGLVKRFGKVRNAAPAAALIPAIVAAPAANPAPEVVEPPKTTAPELFPVVNFDFDQSKLTAAARSTLVDVAARLRNSNESIMLEGHTDWIASEEYNQPLSERRALRVRDFLIENGVASDRIEYKAFGESKPKDTNQSEAGRARNRRVEILSN